MSDDGRAPNGYTVEPPRGLFYDGSWHDPRGGKRATINPSNGEELVLVPYADSHDIEAVVRSAHAGFAIWKSVSTNERYEALTECARRLEANADELAFLDSLNSGNPLSDMKRDVHTAASQLKYFAALVHTVKGETSRTETGLNFTLREPIGVVARIVAYNHPLLFAAGKIAPVLAAGNAVIMKAAEQAPLSAFKFAELTQDLFPPGVLNVISGDKEAGQLLVTHPLVQKVAVIGSSRTGAAILRSVADKIIPVALELGGKNALIIFDDADLERASTGAVQGMNFSIAGQSCGSTSRCFIHRSIYEEMIERIRKEVAQSYQCGIPTRPDTTMGSLISESHLHSVEAHIRNGIAAGARLVLGGRRPTDAALERGSFIEPTIFADVSTDMELFKLEIFGPVLSIIPWSDEKQLLRMVNDTEYGLTASIWTRDISRALSFSSAIEAGYIWINDSSKHYIGADFGGYKKSGLGREEGFEELLAYTQTKNVHVNI